MIWIMSNYHPTGIMHYELVKQSSNLLSLTFARDRTPLPSGDLWELSENYFKIKGRGN